MALSAEELAELQSLEAQKKAGALDFTPEEQAELAALEVEFGGGAGAEEGYVPDSFIEGAKDVGAGVLGALDYAGGLARTSAGGLYDLGQLIAAGGDASKFKTVSAPNAVARALQAKAPTTEEMLERGGVPEGPGRFWGGMAGDILLDPINLSTMGLGGALKAAVKSSPWVSKAVGPLTEIGNMTRPISGTTAAMATGAESTADFAYKSALKNVDEELAQKGKEIASPLLKKYGIWGSHKGMHSDLDWLSRQFKKERDDLFLKGDVAGARVTKKDIRSDVAKLLRKERKKARTTEAKKEVRELSSWINKNTFRQKSLSLEDATDEKMQIGTKIKNWDAKNMPFPQDAARKFYNILQKNVEKSANKADPGLGKKIKDRNKEWQVLLDTDSPLAKETRKEVRRNTWTPVDTLTTMAAWFGAGPKAAASTAAIKKGTDIAKTATARTGTAKAIENLVAAPLRGATAVARPLDAAGMRALQNMAIEERERRKPTPPTTPWQVWQNVMQKGY